ncbi:cytochrome c oxidase subunit NDUFA4-like [Dendronephthya gigantea]|uniref:cytochrome c oxidase subunit NDUFA4-like n=1 Tax=Dendronephthya gigantea TaxID=151771 RepID=UPI00106A1532|nr:cytochrome c oxidase subunit NDUFA4-like [Dendronephthya gigantea]XP_028392835.1 cytochrome c oxidase subunit NDUFA4-like [Dendronephthya gigantea]
MSALRFMIKHKEIVPVLVCVGFGCSFGVFMLTRAAIKYPDVVFDKKNNPTPWLNVKPNEQVKLYSPTMDFSKLKSDRPDID